MEARELSDDQLLQELMDWFRIGRNEGGLKGAERKFFQNVCDEIVRRGLLKDSELYRDN